MPQLHVSTGDGQERDVDLGDKPVSFGRAEDNDVVLTEQKASRRHCTIRPLTGGWRVVDEQSSNGTWLGGRPVLSARLQSGDEIEIGDTVITFVAQPSELQQPEIVRPRRRRGIRVPWEAPILAALLAVGAWFGAGQFGAELTAREASSWKRYAAAEIARAAVGHDETAWRASLERSLRELAHHERARDAEAMVRDALAAGMPQEETPAAANPDWAGSLEQLEASRARMSPTERRSRLRDVLSRHAGDADAVAAVTAVLKADAEAARERGTAEAARLLGDADKAVAEGAFGRALDDWAAWLVAAPEISRDEERAVAAKMAAAREEAKVAAAAAVAAYEDNLKEGRITAAASAVDAAIERLRGTGWDAWLGARTGRFDRGAGGDGATPVAGAPREGDVARAKRAAKDRLDRAMRSSNAFATQRRFADAAAALNEAAADVGDAGLHAELRARADDLGAEADVLAKLLEQARADASHFGVVPLEGGTGRVTGANDATFLVGDPKGANPHPVALDALPPAAYLQILDKARVEPPSFVGAALLCREVGEQAGYVAWMRKALGVDALRMDASVVHARILGVALPAAGFVPHPTDAKAICTFDERKAIENAAKIASLTAELAKVVKKVDATKQAKQVQTVQAAYAKLEAARKHALDLIFDEVKYFYPYRNRMKEYVPVQKDVDDRVALVREAWEDAAAPVKVRPDAALEKLMKQADDLRVEIAFLGGAPGDLTDQVERLRLYLGRDLTVQTFFETPADLALLDYNREMMEANAKVKNGVAEPEREQVRITNEYRRMMGHRRVLRLHEKLVASARGHSDDMSKLGFFDHFSPVEGKKTPMDRMLLAGYPNQPCSENIHMGSSDAQGAHNGWIHSSGHHRNILMPGWSEMGTGQSGRYWTQNFGFASGDEQVGGAGPQ